MDASWRCGLFVSESRSEQIASSSSGCCQAFPYGSIFNNAVYFSLIKSKNIYYYVMNVIIEQQGNGYVR